MSEIWKPVVGHEERYEVSDQGNVRSLGWVGTDTLGRVRTWPAGPMKPTKASHGYPVVDLKSPAGSSKRMVHHLVLEAFVGPRPEGHEACHGNGDREDARLENLRWDTHSANIRDAVAHGSHGRTRRTHCPFGHPLVAPNLVVSNARQGGRTCLACSRARAYAKYHDIEVTQELRDSYFQQAAA